MSDPIIRKLIATNRAVNRLQSAHTMSFSPNTLYSTFFNPATQGLYPDVVTFLLWGYSLIDSTDNLSSTSNFVLIEDSSLIIIPEQGYYGANVSLAWNADFPGTPTATLDLYINDVVVQSLTQTASSTNNSTNYSFLFFAESKSEIQFAIKSNLSGEILSTNGGDSSVPNSPTLNIFKIV